MTRAHDQGDEFTRQGRPGLTSRDRALLLDDPIFERLAGTITLLAPDGTIRATTTELRLTLSYDQETWDALQLPDLLHPDDLPVAIAMRDRLLTHPAEAVAADLRMRHAEGHWEIIHCEAVNRLGSELAGIVVTSRTVTAERRGAALRSDEIRALELIGGGASLAEIFFVLTELVEAQVDDGVAAILLVDEHDVLRAGAAPRIPSELFAHVEGLQLDLRDGSFGSSVRFRTELTVADVNAEPRLSDLREIFATCGMRGCWSVPITYADRSHGMGSIVVFYPHHRGPGPYEREAVEAAARLAGIAMERDRLESQIHGLARHDPLTGLPNRSTLTRLLDRLLSRPGRPDRIVAVMFLDVDAFNLINDSLGHEAGDQLLSMFADRLDRVLPDHATLARFGGDEFVILVDHAHGHDETRRIATDIEQVLAAPFDLHGQDVFLTASIGVAIPHGEATADDLLCNADAAMYQAKQRGRGGYVLFEEGMRAQVVDRLQAESRLRHAIDRHEFTLRYQPKIDLSTGRIIGAEALLRWNHPEEGLVLPGKVIPWAENTGLIVQLGAWVLETAIQQARAWAHELHADDDHFVLAVNVSTRQIASAGFPQTVAETLRRHEWPAVSLSLEITESAMLSDTETSLDALRRIKDIGVLLAVDDFGTGYSSLSYLHRFPIDIVKVDRAFVADMGEDHESPVASAVVAMADALGLITAAEGIETETQLAAVRELGCDWGQGFLFSEALPPPEFTELLRRDPSW